MPWSRYCLNHEHNISFYIVSLIQPLTETIVGVHAYPPPPISLLGYLYEIFEISFHYLMSLSHIILRLPLFFSCNFFDVAFVTSDDSIPFLLHSFSYIHDRFLEFYHCTLYLIRNQCLSDMETGYVSITKERHWQPRQQLFHTL